MTTYESNLQAEYTGVRIYDLEQSGYRVWITRLDTDKYEVVDQHPSTFKQEYDTEHEAMVQVDVLLQIRWDIEEPGRRYPLPFNRS